MMANEDGNSEEGGGTTKSIVPDYMKSADCGDWSLIMENKLNILEANSAAFKSIVLAHMNALPADEWKRLRELALDKSRNSCGTDETRALATREEIVASATSQAGISVDEILIPKFRANAQEIGSLDGQPVFYVNGAGIYFWGPNPTSRSTLNLWLTYPAYPPGW